MNIERKINLMAYVTACLWFLSCVACLVIGEHIGWNGRDKEVATLTTQLETERAALAEANEQLLLKKIQSARDEMMTLYRGVTLLASWYGPGFHGRRTANGETYDMHRRTAASLTHPFGTLLLLRNLKNNRLAFCRITDRGPYIEGRELDVSYRIAQDLGMVEDGLAVVHAIAIPQDLGMEARGDDGD